MPENVRKNTLDFYHAWRKYCAVKNWREAGRHVDWAFEEDCDTWSHHPAAYREGIGRVDK